MVQLIFVGDLAITDEETCKQTWDFPIEGFPSTENRILVNWEFPVGTRLNSSSRVSGKRYLALPEAPQVIRKWSPGFASLATNHLLDAGPEGVGGTIDALKKAGFSTFGAGETVEKIQSPLVWETDQGKITIVNWVFADTHPDWNTVPGVNCWPGVSKARAVASELRSQTDWLIALLHWSDELFPYPRQEDRQTARALADMGFDLVIAHHPHVVRGMEMFGSVPVYYSLGNFFFSDMMDSRTGLVEKHAPLNREGLGLKVSFVHGEKPVCKPLSFWQSGNRVDYDQKLRAEKRLKAVSRPLEELKDDAYEVWYSRKRKGFERWGARWHFIVRRLGLQGMARYLLKKIQS